jgi:transposase
MSKPVKTLDDALVLINKQAKLIEELSSRLEWFNRHAFGQKSEKIIEPMPERVDLFGDEIQSENTTPTDTVDIPGHKRKKQQKSGHGRNELDLSKFDVVPIYHNVPKEQQQCPLCNTQMCQCGQSIINILKSRTELYVEQHVYPKYACKEHPEKGVFKEKTQPRYIPKGIADESVIAKIVSDKWEDNIPLRRQETRMARQGAKISASSMIDWITTLSGDLEKVLEEAKKQMFSNDILYSDDTRMPVVSDKKGKVKIGYFWTWSDGRRFAVFDYSPTRAQTVPIGFLKEWKGYLHSDAYAAYNAVHAKGVTPVYCWAHARRKFFDAFKAGNQRAKRPLQIIGRMFRVEKMLKENPEISSDKALEWRQRVSAKCEQQLYSWCRKQDGQAPPTLKLGQAMTYYQNQRTGLQTYLTDARLCIDNNLSERNLRAVVIGRKNWLFAGNDEAAKRSAIMYSIIATCKLQGIKATDYLEKFMRKIAVAPQTPVEELLPGVL